MIEEWRKVKGFEYYVSSMGNVKSSSGTLKTKSISGNGYQSVSLWKNNKEKRILLHRLVAEHFIGEISGLEVNHKDFNKCNNTVENLEIVSRDQNVIHAKKGNRYTGNTKCIGSKNNATKLNEDDVVNILKMKSSGSSYKQIMDIFPIKKSALSCIISRKTWGHVRV